MAGIHRRATCSLAALLAVLVVLAASASAQAATVNHYSCTWQQQFQLVYDSNSGGVIGQHGGSYSGSGYGSCVHQSSPTAPVWAYDLTSDTGSWTNSGAGYYSPLVCDNIYPLNHQLTGVAQLTFSDDGDSLTVPYELTEAGAVALKANGAYSNWYPGEQVSVEASGYMNSFDACPNQRFGYTGALDITTVR